MPIGKVTNPTDSISPASNRQTTPADAGRFKDKKVSSNETHGTTVNLDSHSELDSFDGKSIRNRSATTVSDTGTQSTELDSQSDSDSFYSAAESLDEIFLDANNFFIDDTPSSSEASDSSQSQDITVNKDAVEHLEKADSNELNRYIDDFTEVNQQTNGESGIAADLKTPLKSLVEYNNKLDADLQRLNTLAEKLQGRGLSNNESVEMKALMHCHKYNLSLAQGWLATAQDLRARAGTMNEPTAALFQALSQRLADRHMALADSVTLHADSLPDREPISREDRIGYNLLTARASLRAFKTIARSKKNYPRVLEKFEEPYRQLVRHCKALEHAARLSRGRVQMDAAEPQLKLESLNAWTEDFNLVDNKADKKPLPQKDVAELNRSWDEGSTTLPLSHPRLSQRSMTRLFLENQLPKAGIDISEISRFDAAYEASLITEINQGDWSVIDKTMKFTIDDKEHTCRSKITPGAHLAERFQSRYRSNGISYMDRLQTQHAPNLAHTQLTAEDGEVLFSGVRHGILDAYNYHDEKVRQFSDAQLTKIVTAVYDDHQKTVNKSDIVALKRELEVLEAEEEDTSEVMTFAAERDVLGNVIPGTETSVTKNVAHRRFLERVLETRYKDIQSIVHEVKSDPAKRAQYIEGMRQLASRNMAHEVLSAAIVSDPNKLQAALDGETVDVTLNSVVLVTPDWVRAHYMRGGPKDEQLMLQHQASALQSLDSSRSPNKPVELKIRDEEGQLREVKAHVKVRVLNFGVNEYALARTMLPADFPVWRNLMGWGFSARLNNPQLQDLLGPSNRSELGGDVAEKLQALENSENSKIQKQATLLREAATQAKAIWRNRSFWSGNNEPYKMVSRLALISHLMGETTLFNCKSGKDRTGQLDAEAKYLAAVGHATGHIPEPDLAHTDESRKMRTTFTLNAGNMELQRMNTGLPGYKLRNVPGLENMLADDTLDIYQGGSDTV